MKRFTFSSIAIVPLVLLLVVSTGCTATQKKPVGLGIGKIAFTGKVVKTNFTSVFTMDTDGSNLVELEDRHDWFSSPDPRQSWSQDGALYVYDDGYSLYVVGSEGNDRRQIMDLHNQQIDSFSMAGNGKNVLVTYKSPDALQDKYVTRIATIDTTTGKLTTIADVPDVKAYAAVYSPDGKKIAFIGRFFGPVYDTEVYIINADGTGLRKLTDFVITWPVPSYQSGDWPADGVKALTLYPYSGALYWSPDSKKILTQVVTWEVSDFEHITDIFVVDVSSGESTNLTNSPKIYDSSPAWSPDSKHIAYSADRKIYLMDSNGENVRMLVDLGTAAPSWLPDGSGIMFTNPAIAPNIRAIDLDGNNLGTITSTAVNSVALPVWLGR